MFNHHAILGLIFGLILAALLVEPATAQPRDRDHDRDRGRDFDRGGDFRDRGRHGPPPWVHRPPPVYAPPYGDGRWWHGTFYPKGSGPCWVYLPRGRQDWVWVCQD